jgi:hypothetical protein
MTVTNVRSPQSKSDGILGQPESRSVHLLVGGEWFSSGRGWSRSEWWRSICCGPGSAIIATVDP